MTAQLETPVRLGDLVDVIDTSHDDPLRRVSNAAELAEQLGDTADALIGHFIDQARRAGASWSAIGASMGTSKQAAQKRFVNRSQDTPAPLDPSQGFSRFRDDARAVVVAAQERARESGNDTISIGHLVLGLITFPDSTAAGAITSQGVSAEEVERTVLTTLRASTTTVPALIPFDTHAKTALQGSFAQAQRHGADSVGSEHVLLSILAVDAGTGVLAGLGITPETVEVFLEAKDQS